MIRGAWFHPVVAFLVSFLLDLFHAPTQQLLLSFFVTFCGQTIFLDVAGSITSWNNSQSQVSTLYMNGICKIVASYEHVARTEERFRNDS